MVYLYERYWGSWEDIISRGLFYGSSALITLYFVIDLMRGSKTVLHYHTTVVYFCSWPVVYVLFSMMLFGVLSNGVFYLFLYTGAMVLLSFIFLFNEIRYEQK